MRSLLRVAAATLRPPRSPLDRGFAIPAFLLLVALLFFFRLGHRDLYSSHEARAAQNAQRMLDTGEWGLPVLFDGQSDLQKPPGYYWLVAAAGWLNGGVVTEFEARFPAALAGLITVLMVFGFLHREGRPTAAWIAAGTLATAVHFTAIARTARIDVPLTCAVAGSLLCFWNVREARGASKGRVPPLLAPRASRTCWAAASAVFAASGVLLKGPVALALIGPVAVLWLLTSPKPTDGRRWALPISLTLGTALFFTLTLPWFLWANHVTGGEFFRVFFWHHNVERFAGTSPSLASHPWWYYGPRFAVDFLPWSPLFAILVFRARRASKGAADPHFRFGMIWFALMFVVLSTAHFKRADYLLPLYPGAAIALGCAAESWLGERASRPRYRWAFGIVLAVAFVGWQVMSFVVEPAEQAKEEKHAFATMIREHAPAPNEVMLFRTEPHLLAWHLGRPIFTRVEWHDLNDWASAPGTHFVVMPPEYAAFAQHIVRSRKLVEVARLADYTSDKPPRPLVFIRIE